MRETESLARRDLQTILRLVDLGKVTISATFYPTGATLSAIGSARVRRLLQRLDGNPITGRLVYNYAIGFIKPFAWVMLLQAGKLVAPNVWG